MDAWGDEARVIPFQDAARESGRATKMYGTYGEGPRAACLGHRGGPTSKQKHREMVWRKKHILLTPKSVEGPRAVRLTMRGGPTSKQKHREICGGPTSKKI